MVIFVVVAEFIGESRVGDGASGNRDEDESVD